MSWLFFPVSILSKYIVILLLISSSCKARLPAYRVCKPGPPLAYPIPVNSTRTTLKNCLIIGDSVSIGYTPHVKEILKDVCQVQHAPWDSSDGGALDTKYALQCMSLFLSTASGMATHYDAIIFNFGLHDVQYCPGKYTEEYVPYKEYLSNIEYIASRLNLTGAKLGFVSSTPVPYSEILNNRVKKYNNGVKKILKATGNIMFVDLYEKVVDICGEPVFNSCFIMDTQPNVHYKSIGYSYIGVFVSKLFLTLLKQPQIPEKQGDITTAGKEIKMTEKKLKQELIQSWKICQKENFISTKELKQNFLKSRSNIKSFCKHNSSSADSYFLYQLNMTTACPPTMTCCKSVYSNTGIGCCVIPDANGCADNFHCCPRGMNCLKNCGKGSDLCYCVTKKVQKVK